MNELAPHGIIPSISEIKEYSPIIRNFLPTLKLLQGTSSEINEEALNVNREPIKNQVGDFYLAFEKINFGKKVIVIYCGHRLHALKLVDNKKVTESFNPSSPIYQEIVNERDDKDKKVLIMYGYEFMFYIPSIMDFATVFFSKKTFRPVSHDIFRYLRDPKQRDESEKDLLHTMCFELSSKFVIQKMLRYWIPVILPLECQLEDLPAQKSLAEALKSFNQPVENEPKITKEESTY